MEASVIINKIREGKGDFGYNARTDEYVNLYEAGVIDPTKASLYRTANSFRQCHSQSHLHKGRYLTQYCNSI